MATIEILGWKGFVGGSGWDRHAKSVLSRRLRSGMEASQHDIKHLTRQIHSRERVTLHNIREEAVLGVTQILRLTGAEMRVTVERGKSQKLFKKWPKR